MPVLTDVVQILSRGLLHNTANGSRRGHGIDPLFAQLLCEQLPEGPQFRRAMKKPLPANRARSDAYVSMRMRWGLRIRICVRCMQDERVLMPGKRVS
ncbi:hypothetical protein WK24_10805 [Burkholderia vietnamiensis]|nr:hypothetical protein WK24_10805 [Burkholderia vietnamiensis]